MRVRPRPKEIREWIAFSAGLLGAVLGTLGYRQSLETERKSSAATLQSNLNEAWNLLGGGPGTESLVRVPDLAAINLAEERIRLAAITSPHDPDVHRLRAVCLDYRGRDADAEREFQEALKYDPQNARVYNALGTLLEKMGRAKEAEEKFRAAIAKDSSLAIAWINLGQLLQEQQRIGEALTAFREGIRLNPNWAFGHLQLCALLYDQKSPDALASCTDAIRLNGRAATLGPDAARAHNISGCIYRDRGEIKKAELAYRKAIAIDPTFDVAHDNLAGLVAWSGKQSRTAAPRH